MKNIQEVIALLNEAEVQHIHIDAGANCELYISVKRGSNTAKNLAKALAKMPCALHVTRKDVCSELLARDV